MAIPTAQRDVAAFLRSLAGTDPVETHISLVFVGSDTVYKLKKAIKLSFLDFTDVEERHRLLRREVELNTATASGLYRDVAFIGRRPDGSLALNDGAVLDWVLRMAPIPRDDLLDRRIGAGPLDWGLLDALADAVAAFHEQAPPARLDPVVAMTEVLDGNVRAAREAGLPESDVAAWGAAAHAALRQYAPMLRSRAEAGQVRRGHGDLHLGNVCIWRGKPVPFDALEFSEALATIDTAYDLAFLLMDLDVRTGRGAANRVMNRYVARTGDAGLTGLLPLFLSLRAMVLAHVQRVRRNAEASARYLCAALEYLRPVPGVVVAVGGLPGTGKSTLARALAPGLGRAPGALVLRSDEIRKRRNNVPPEERLPAAAYTDAESQAVFATLAELVAIAAHEGQAVIADATFIDPAHRRAVHQAAGRAGVPFLGLWLDAPLPVLEARIVARRNDASDATVAVLRKSARAKTIPPKTSRTGAWIMINAVDAAQTLAEATKAVLQTQPRPIE